MKRLLTILGFVVLAELLAVAQTLITKVYVFQFQQQTTLTSNPPRNSSYLYVGTDGKLKCTNSDGSSCLP